MAAIKILWADDEIDLLKPQIIFLEQKGYTVDPVSNGHDALDKCKNEHYDLIFLDEHMPGISGLETLSQIKAFNSDIPVVMITKNEEENIMEEAIGAQISDYLIKPVKPNQILLSIKKIIDNKKLVSEKTATSYRQEFQNIMMELNNVNSHQEWAELYKKLIYWELELEKINNPEMKNILDMQKAEANKEFFKFISKNYLSWLKAIDKSSTPTLSHTLFKKNVFPLLQDNVPTFLLLIDNLRYDHFKMMEALIKEDFKKVSEDYFYSILPTTTQYSRNAIFSGLTPLEIDKKYPDKWFYDDENAGKNLNEDFFLNEQLKRNNINIKSSYTKITNYKSGKDLEDTILNL